ncbi:MAG: hypothetical protein ACQGVK_01995 [Myxococcota bacterium]
MDSPSSLRILLIERNASLRLSLERSLRSRGAQVRACANARDARAAAPDFRPDVVLAEAAELDALRGLDGVRERGAGAVIAMLEAGSAARPDAVVSLQKPFTAERLDQAIGAASRLRRRGPPLSPPAG